MGLFNCIIKYYVFSSKSFSAYSIYLYNNYVPVHICGQVIYIVSCYSHGQDNTERQRFGGAISQIAISEVFKGGSLGKGTTVPGDFDVDLIIFSRCELYHK